MENQTVVIPQVKFLGAILNNIAKGQLRVPKFQRPFVWKPQDMIDLFDSIANGYSIGSLLFWKADEIYNSLSVIGPHQIPAAGNKPINYILDGHQRLSTLFGILVRPTSSPISIDHDYWRWTIYYDLETDFFLHIIKESELKDHFIPLHKLWKTIEFIHESKRIAEKFPGQKGIQYVEKAERLAQSIKEYQIAITQIEGGKIDTAVHIFSRLNSKGVKVSYDRMYSALTYKEGEHEFNLSERIDTIIQKLDQYNFSGINRTTIFRSILAAEKKNIYIRANQNLFPKTQSTKTYIKIVNECEVSLLKAAQFLHQDLKVPSANFLPYSLQLILLSEFFRLCPNPNSTKIETLTRWFWVTSFVGLWTSNTSRMYHALEEMRKFARNRTGHFQFTVVDFDEVAIPFPYRFNLTNARVRAFVLFLMSLHPKSIENSNNKLDARNLLSQYGYKALSYIIAQDNRLANRILLGPQTYGVIQKRLKNNPENFLFVDKIITQKTLQSHAITPEALQALKAGDDELFLNLREQELIRLEREFMVRNGVQPSTTTAPVDMHPDTD